MINIINHTLNMDLANKINMNSPINIKQNDTNSHKFIINLFNSSASHSLINTTSRIYFKKPDGTKVFLSCVLDGSINNKLSVLLTTQALTAIGSVACEITIYGTSGEIQTSFTFNFNVLENIRDDEAIESTNDFTALTDALAVVTTIANKADKTYVDTNLDIVNSQLAEIVQQLYVTPESFGAIGDGITDDSIAVYNATLNAVNTGRYVLFTKKYALNDNTFRENVDGIVDLDNITWIGTKNSELLSTINHSLSGDIIFFENCNNILIDGIAFSNSSTDTSQRDNTVVFAYCSNIQVRNCHFKKSNNKHIHFHGTISNLLLENNIFEKSTLNQNVTSHSFWVGAVFFYANIDYPLDLDNIIIRNNIFKDNAFLSIQIAADISNDNIVSNAKCKIYGNSFFQTGAISIIGVGGVEIYENIFEQVGLKSIEKHYTYNSTNGAYISNVRLALGETIDATNRMVLDASNGISPINISKASDVSVYNNVFKDLYAYNESATWAYGISINTPDRFQFTGNTILELAISEPPTKHFYNDIETVATSTILKNNIYYLYSIRATTSAKSLFNFTTGTIATDNKIFGSENINLLYPALRTPAIQDTINLATIDNSPCIATGMLRKVGNLLQFNGSIKITSLVDGGVALLTLPYGYRPPYGSVYAYLLPILKADLTTTTAILKIQGDGKVAIYQMTSAMINESIYLDSIVFMQ